MIKTSKVSRCKNHKIFRHVWLKCFTNETWIRRGKCRQSYIINKTIDALCVTSSPLLILLGRPTHNGIDPVENYSVLVTRTRI